LAGDPAALAAAFGPGGWLVVPLAMAFGAGAALAGRALDRAEVCLARRMHQRPRRAPRSVARPRLVLAPNLASRTLAFGLARRPPPSLALTG
jgi:hypothetical protein